MKKLNLLEELKKLSKNSYCKYSNFKVSSIVILKTGQMFKGVNLENFSYGATICAERSALCATITNGYSKSDIKSLALYTNSNNDLIFPCGICLQFMIELMNLNSKIIIYNNTQSKEYILKDLFPCSKEINFGKI